MVFKVVVPLYNSTNSMYESPILYLLWTHETVKSSMFAFWRYKALFHYDLNLHFLDVDKTDLFTCIIDISISLYKMFVQVVYPFFSVLFFVFILLIGRNLLYFLDVIFFVFAKYFLLIHSLSFYITSGAFTWIEILNFYVFKYFS